MMPLRFPEHPRVLRIRNLDSKNAPTLLCEIRDFPKQSHGSVLAPDGTRFLAFGADGHDDFNARLYEVPTGREIRRFDLKSKSKNDSLKVDPSGAVMAFSDGETPFFINASDGSIHATGLKQCCVLGPNAVFHTEEDKDLLPSLCKVGNSNPVFRITKFGRFSYAVFSRDGRRIAYAMMNGAVVLVDVPVVEQFLKERGLDGLR